jgi:hypothetical protein
MLKTKEKRKWVKKVASLLLILGISSFLFFYLSPVYTQEAPASGDTFQLQDFENTTMLGTSDFRIIIAKIIRAVLGLLGIVALGIVLYGGYLIMTSGGQEDKITQGKKVLINGTIGLAIILSAFSIAQFILSSLNRAIRGGGGNVPIGEPGYESFSGSGALGNIIKDHYPYRNQKEVKRNTAITVTFREPIDPETVVKVDTNGSKVLGDCVRQDGIEFDPRLHCDELDISKVRIYRSADETKTLVQAYVKIVYESAGEIQVAKSFLFMPFDFLGSDTEAVDYTVELTGDIKKADGKTSAFTNTRGGKYWWEFQTDTTFDYDAPQVVSVYPQDEKSIARNHVIQINFSEAMDPTTVQGKLDGSFSFTNIIFGTTTIYGEWRISNGYRTLEFIPQETCGRNSCGEPMYCLPMLCPTDSITCVSSPYEILIRTATSDEGDKWQATGSVDGVLDLAQNTLDTAPIGVRNQKPTAIDPGSIGLAEKNPDNYYWNFVVKNEIDRTIPFIESITPAVDEEGVNKTAELWMTFNLRMLSYYLGEGIGLIEYGIDEADIPSGEEYEDIGFNVRTENLIDETREKTRANIAHRYFKPYDLDAFYFTAASSLVRSVNQQCLYPGRGPAPIGSIAGADGANCEYTEGTGSAPDQNQGCLPVEVTSAGDKDTGCAWGGGQVLFGDVESCIQKLKTESELP